MAFLLGSSVMLRSSRALAIGLLCGVLSICHVGSSLAVEFQFGDPGGMMSYGYAATAKPKPGTTYLLVVGVHGLGGNGRGAGGAMQLVNEFPDVIVLGPTFASPELVQRQEQREVTKEDYYQMCGPVHEKKVNELIEEISKVWPLHPKVVLHGFSAGAQFAHRYAMKNPDKVAGVSAHSGGSWAKLDGADKINKEAKAIPFMVSVGEADIERSTTGQVLNRFEETKKFADDLKSLEFPVEFKSWPRIAHQYTPPMHAMTKDLVKKVREGYGIVDDKTKAATKGKK
jgi:predicted esterase